MNRRPRVPAKYAWPCATLLLLVACGPKSKPLPVYNQVPDFVLTAQSGWEFRKQALDGKVWVADFIFTTCSGPCPRMTSEMRRLQTQVKDVALVSFTVDPEHDTPQVLADYAKRFQAEPDRWHFLTGSRDNLQLMMRQAFMLGDVNMTHSTRFVLVDRKGRVRGYYDTTDPRDLQRLVADIHRLNRDKS